MLSLALRIFFRRIEVVGLEQIPAESPVIFVLNHPNGLVDPVFILCLAPRRVSFLAKEPLFRMPVIGYLVKSLDALPVYRQQDQGADTSRNRETFVAARALLARGGALAICPEGVSHDEPRLKPIKSGAARIALGAASTGRNLGIKIVPAGLYYTSKTTFRSSALLLFGEPLTVDPVELDNNDEPSRDAVNQLSERIEDALREVMLHAEHEEALGTIARAERIFSSELPDDQGGPSLMRELELKKLFLDGYALLQEHEPAKIVALDARMNRYEEQLERIKLDPDEVEHPHSASMQAFMLALPLALFILLTPLALVGALIHYPAYRLAGFVAKKLSKTYEDIVSTIKIVAAMLFFPLTWLVAAIAAYELWGWWQAVGCMVLVPLSGYLAIRFFEELDRFVGAVRSLVFFMKRRRFFLRLVVERRAIYEEIIALGQDAQRLAEQQAVADV